MKPLGKAKKSEFVDKFKAKCKAAADRGRNLILVTDVQILKQPALRNLKVLHRYSTQWDLDDYLIVVGEVKKIGVVKIQYLLDHLDIGQNDLLKILSKAASNREIIVNFDISDVGSNCTICHGSVNPVVESRFGCFGDEFEDLKMIDPHELEKISALAELDKNENYRYGEGIADSMGEKEASTAKNRLIIINHIMKNIQGGWTEKNIAPLIDELLFSGDIDKKVSWRTVKRWYDNYDKNHPLTSLAPSHKSKGVRQGNSLAELGFFKESLEKRFLVRERPTINNAYEYYCDRILIANKGLSVRDRVVPIKQRAYYYRVWKLEPYDVMAARYGKRSADIHFRDIGMFKKPTRVLERVEIDHTPLDLMLIDDSMNVVLGRPFFTALIDTFSNCILGFHLGYHNPGYDVVRSAILNACLSKSGVREKFPSIMNEWLCEGKVDTIVADNAAEFWSSSFEDLCLSQGINIEYNPTGKPWKKPMAERFFGLYKDKFVDKIPGKTFSSIAAQKDYKPEKHAILPFSVFVEVLYKWIIDVYHFTPNSRGDYIPAYAWELGSREFPAVTYSGVEEEMFKIDALPFVSSDLTREGITIDRVRYSSPELSDYRKTNPPTQGKRNINLKVKRDSLDISYVYIYLPGKKAYLKVKAVDPDNKLAGMSIFQYKTIRKIERHFCNAYNEKFESDVAEARIGIDEKINEALRSGSHNKPKKIAGMKSAARYKGISSDGNYTLYVEGDKERRPTIEDNKDREKNNSDMNKLDDWDDLANDLDPY